MLYKSFIGCVLSCFIGCGAHAVTALESLYNQNMELMISLEDKYGNAWYDVMYNKEQFKEHSSMCNSIMDFVKGCSVSAILNSSNTDFLKQGTEFDCGNRRCYPAQNETLFELVMINFACTQFMMKNNVECNSVGVDENKAAFYFKGLVRRYDQEARREFNNNIKSISNKCEYNGYTYKCVYSIVSSNGEVLMVCGTVTQTGENTFSGKIRNSGYIDGVNAITPKDVDNDCQLM